MAKKWEITTDRYVAFLDIMGFKDLVQKMDHNAVLKKLMDISESRDTLKLVNEHRNQNIALGTTKSYTFSDSIFIFSRSDSEEDAHKLVVDSLFILQYALSKQIPIKGAISFGKITVDIKKSIYFGQPLIDAYLLHEDLNLYGVISDHNFENKMTKMIRKYFEKYSVPLKYGRINHYLIKPTYEKIPVTIDYLNKMYSTVSGNPRRYIDNSIEFLNSIMKTKSL